MRSITTTQVSDVTYLIAGGSRDNGVSVFSVGADDGHLTNIANISDDGLLRLSSPWDVTAQEINGSVYVAVASRVEGGVSLFELSNDPINTTGFVEDGAPMIIDPI